MIRSAAWVFRPLRQGDTSQVELLEREFPRYETEVGLAHSTERTVLWSMERNRLTEHTSATHGAYAEEFWGNELALPDDSIHSNIHQEQEKNLTYIGWLTILKIDDLRMFVLQCRRGL